MVKMTIELDFAASIKQAEEIERIADDLKNLADNKMSDTVSEMQSCWKGDSAQAFFAKSSIVQGNLEETAEKLMEIAQSIRSAAKKMYDAEMEALRIAETVTNLGGK